MDSLLEIKDVSLKTPEGRLLQRRLAFSVPPSKLILIRGPNGSGKSTLIKAIAGLGRIAEGEIKLGVRLSAVQFLPQLENTETHMPLTLLDVVSLSLKRRVSTAEACRPHLLTEQQLEASWNTASGGERKRALLTCALLTNPSLLLLDEPMNHLDQTSRRSMIESMARYLQSSTAKRPRAIVMVCHQGLREIEKELFNHDEINLVCLEDQSWKRC